MNNEPKAEGDGLEDAAKAFLDSDEVWRIASTQTDESFTAEVMVQFARQQRREAVADFVERMKIAMTFRLSGNEMAGEVQKYAKLMQAVAKEMNDDSKTDRGRGSSADRQTLAKEA